MVSIIIPIYNEEKTLSDNSTYFKRLREEAELIFVDGGSSDRSLRIAKNYGRVLVAKKGRACQMNYGASFAKGGILFFLHADTLIPLDAILSIEKKLAKGDFIGGCLTQRIGNNGLIYRLIERQGNIRAHLTREFYGDQGIFVKKEIFLKIQGFPEAPIMEDIIFTKRLRMQGKTLVLPDKIIVSPRRWEKKGLIKTALLYSLISILFVLRFPLKRIKNLYDDLR